MTIKTTVKLPDRLSELLEVALRDLRLVEKDDAYVLAMSTTWHSPTADRPARCLVCLAGAVMAKTFQMPIGEECDVDDFEEETALKLRALDRLRVGFVYAALDLNLPGWFHPKDMSREIDIIPYNNNPTLFKEQLQALANDLKQRGL